MDYKQSVEYLQSRLPMFSRIGAAAYKPGLDTTTALDRHYGHPHTRYKTIHVAGTNGKGSVSHALAAMLIKAGYKTGLYTSPHLASFRERIRINGEMIPQQEVVNFTEEFRNSGYDGNPSFFELTMMMAFKYFADCGVDYAVIEVGMGGRLDSTNVITPEMSVITNISADHTQFLGETPTAIASEKAGIIKPGIPVVIGEAEGDVMEVFENKALQTGSPLISARNCGITADISASKVNSGFTVRSSLLPEFNFPLGGDYQKNNIMTILASLKVMRECGISITDSQAAEALSCFNTLTGLRGRWDIISNAPLTIADTGHNIAGMTSNMRQLKAIMSERPEATLHFVIGFVADKDIDHIIPLLPEDATYYFTNAAIPRALPADKLTRLCQDRGLKGETFSSVAEALSAAKAAAAGSDVVFIGGSTFVVAEIYQED